MSISQGFVRFLADTGATYLLISEGKLIAPWAVELRTACENARVDLRGRELIVDIWNTPAFDAP